MNDPMTDWNDKKFRVPPYVKPIVMFDNLTDGRQMLLGFLEKEVWLFYFNIDCWVSLRKATPRDCYLINKEIIESKASSVNDDQKKMLTDILDRASAVSPS